MDPYLRYLLNLSATNPVAVVDDIVALNGELLLARSTSLNEKNASVLHNKALARPLASVVRLETMIGPSDLLQHLLATIRSTEYFQRLAEQKHPLSSLEPVCARLAELPLLQQYLTVMAAQMDDLFQRTLCVSLWAFYIAQEMRLPAVEAGDIFWAAIAHDIGMLHIDPLIIYKSEKLTAKDWLRIQSHVDITCRILADIPGLSPLVIAAVSEHHERCDGTGYPLAKVESELSIAGQVLAVADSIVGIYFNRFKAQGRRWRDIIPVLEMNRAAYLYRSCEIVTTMIMRSELPVANVVQGGGVPEFAERMLQQNVHLQHWFAQLRECLTSIGYTHGDRQLHALQNVMLHIATTFNGTMLFKDDLRESLASMANDNNCELGKVIADASVMQHEMTFHLQRLSRMIQMYLASSSTKDPKILLQVQQGFEKIGGYIGVHNTPPVV